MARAPMRTALAAALGLALFSSVPAGSIDFAEALRVPAGLSPSSVAATDLDGDTHVDIVVVHRASDDAWVFLADGSGGFAFFQAFSVGNFPQGVIALDLDGDPHPDLATTAVPFNSGSVTSWLGNGDGTFSLGEVLTADDGTRSVEAADLNGDGRLDLVVTNSTRGNISAFLGDGDGTFGAEERTPVGSASSSPTDLALTDLNGDGDRDVVTSNAQSADQSIARVLGDGDGTFSTPLAFPTTCSRPESVVAGDFDRNGDPDVAIACFDSSEVAVMLGDGAGGFAPPVIYDLLPAMANPYWILSADLDRDGREDLVTSNNGGLSFLRSRGDGTFDPPEHVESLNGSFYGADSADLDGDGWVDLVFADFGRDEVAVYLNRSGSCGDETCPLTLQPAGGGVLSWTAAADAIGYDVIRGDLPLLRSSGGDFSQATEVCLASAIPDLTYTDPALPAAQQGFWYLVREVTAVGRGSYDAFAGNLAASRDAGVGASGNDCP